MKPVHMQDLADAEEAYCCALASLLELERDEVPRFTGMAAGMQYDAWLAAELNLLVARVEQPGPGLWLARMKSPYQGYDVHTAVMQGSVTAWDPHPEGTLMTEEFTVLSCELLVPLDPAAPVGAAALHGAP